jgi:hypothetical protein
LINEKKHNTISRALAGGILLTPEKNLSTNTATDFELSDKLKFISELSEKRKKLEQVVEKAKDDIAREELKRIEMMRKNAELEQKSL